MRKLLMILLVAALAPFASPVMAQSPAFEPVEVDLTLMRQLIDTKPEWNKFFVQRGDAFWCVNERAFAAYTTLGDRLEGRGAANTQDLNFIATQGPNAPVEQQGRATAQPRE